MEGTREVATDVLGYGKVKDLLVAHMPHWLQVHIALFVSHPNLEWKLGFEGTRRGQQEPIDDFRSLSTQLPGLNMHLGYCVL